ncbi:MAG: pyridoxamine 5'-phosphate oxidase [Betaproteobacteria bacterium]
MADLRTEYMRATLDEESVEPDPMRQFERWFGEALKSQLTEPNAMTLATAGADGRPSARIVLLKEFDERGFAFFTNYASRKGRELDAGPWGALLFFWPDLERQVRIEGAVSRMEPADSAAYFAQRPRQSQLGAWASPQSESIAGRAALEARFSAVLDRYRDASSAVPCPPHWGGYRLAPDSIEFWQGRSSRLHDRIRYRREEARRDAWVVERLAP